MNKATIIICGKQTDMLYCAAAETGYEQISGNSSAVFVAQNAKKSDGAPLTNADGTPVVEPPKAKLADYIYLAFAAVIAAYECEGKNPPVTANDILYKASPSEITEIITTIVRLRNEWYEIPTVVKPEEISEEDGDTTKNA